MIYGYWGYNINKNKYEPFSEEPLSLFPTVVEFKKRIVYCRQCHRWEYIIHFSNNILTSQCGKKYAGPFVVENSLINFSYDISKIKDSYLIKVKSQTASINKRFIQDSEYFLDLDKKVLYKNGKSVFENEDIGYSLCKELTNEIICEMGDNYKKQYGIKPTVASELKGFNVIIGYMLSPFNVNFYTIAQHWGLNPYDKNFASLSSGDTPSAENEMYESLGIKPTKALRKMYQKFPQSVICYAATKDLGFTDVNILQRSISSHFYAFLKFCMISFVDGTISYTIRNGLKAYVEDLLAISNQKTVWNSIERTLEFLIKNKGNDIIVTDGILSYLGAREDLTNDEKKEIMREGFNQYTHDFLVRRVQNTYDLLAPFKPQNVNENIEFDIEDKFLDLEYKAGDSKMKSYNPDTGKEEIVDTPDEQRYCFYVARNSSTLREIGSAMHNCVGWGYASSVQERHCTIVYAKYQGAYRICIEVTPNFSIRQSLGPCNQPLGGKDLEAYHEWCTEKNIVFKKAFAVHIAR